MTGKPQKTRLDDEPVEIITTKAVKIGIGYQRCDRCGKETPKPSKEQLQAHASSGDHFIWPFDDWWPAGWITVKAGRSSELMNVTICDDCARGVFAALERRL